MKISLFLLAWLIASGPISAQTTWQSLPFGASAAHVADILARQPPVCSSPTNSDDNDCTGLAMERLEAGTGDWTVQPQPELWLGTLNAPLHFKTLLHFFSADRQLARIDLTLDTDRYKAEGRQASDLVDFAGEPVLAELLGKYGIPLEISAACEPAETRRLLRTHAEIIDCNALWKGQNGTVTLAWTYSAVAKTYLLMVRYAALQSGL